MIDLTLLTHFYRCAMTPACLSTHAKEIYFVVIYNPEFVQSCMHRGRKVSHVRISSEAGAAVSGGPGLFSFSSQSEE